MNYRTEQPNSQDFLDIEDLKDRINRFKKGEIPEERFKHFRLTRGVYGQRQLGVHMFRTKIPFGKLTANQLEALADAAETYTDGNLHLTTRQNIQLHHVKLDDAPKIWEIMASVGMNAREACGNTVRNITASAKAGIDPYEPFDVTPNVQAMYEFFLRNPICQEMGRKIKIAFSSNDADSAFTYFHDFGFLPRIQEGVKGFKVVVAGGLGAQPILAQTAFEFLPSEEIIPFTEAAIRVFDRYGEREKRFRARMKYLVKNLGLEKFLDLVQAERKALAHNTVAIDAFDPGSAYPPSEQNGLLKTRAEKRFEYWRKLNVFEQKQQGWFAVQIKVQLGNLNAETARALSDLMRDFTADDIRITVNQGFLLRFVKEKNLQPLFQGLKAIGLADPGFGSIADITSCPGTDTCNLAVSNSTVLSQHLEELIKREYPSLIENDGISIKMSGCMNSCGQHMAADIGFHGSSIKIGKRVMPAMQVVLGGGVNADGEGFFAERILKVPTRRTPNVLRFILDDFQTNKEVGQDFQNYYWSKGRRYFYNVLKSLSNTDEFKEEEFVDWGFEQDYIQAIGVGECAGVSLDLVSTIIGDAKEKLQLAERALEEKAVGDSIYHSYSAFVTGAKALLLSKDIKCNTHIGILSDFQKQFGDIVRLDLPVDWKTYVLKVKSEVPTPGFATEFLNNAKHFLTLVETLRTSTNGDLGKVVSSYYKA
ncbi:MAG: HEPN domain-containing protein [Bacteroidetes bacterium]|nr:MAG: HEPN domain-containing protein [Bacteroidota bacterium]